jgi:post-segregation antitoxin (ccd killing protein)
MLARVMKEKLTLTVDRAVIKHAKAYARREGVSLSRLVEQQFNQLKGKSFAVKWLGQFKRSPADPTDARLTYLRQKYLAAKR